MKNVNKAFLDIKKDDFTSTYYNDSKRYNDLKTIKKEIKDKETLFNLKLNSLNLNHNTFIDKSTKSGISKVFRNFIIKFLYNFSYRQNDFNKQTLELVNKNNEILTSIKKLIFYYDEEIGVLKNRLENIDKLNEMKDETKNGKLITSKSSYDNNN